MHVISEYGKVAFIENAISGVVAVLGHGYLSDKNSRTNMALIKELSSSGISTLAYDMWGHGDSDGDVRYLTVSKAVSSARAVLKYAQKKYEKIVLVGSSFTGSVSLISGLYEPLNGIALKCPVFDPKALWESRMSKGELETWKKNEFIQLFSKDWHYAVYDEARFFDMPNTVSNINSPIFVVHGDKDITVPIEHAENIKKYSKNCDLKIISGADHFFNKKQHFDEMVFSIKDWIVKVLL